MSAHSHRGPRLIAVAFFFWAGIAALTVACSSGTAGSGSTEAASAPAAGGKCPIKEESVCADPQSVLECRAGVWVPFACRGKAGCKDGTASHATCDDSASNVGEPCPKDKAAACSFDASAELVCTGGKWAVAAKCPGAHACSVAGTYIMCDGGNAVEGQPCAMPATRENVACSADRKTALHCVGNVWAASRTCLGPKGCEIEMGNQLCDTSISKDADACTVKGKIVCSADLKGLLECDGTAFHAKKACPKGCLPNGIISTCE